MGGRLLSAWPAFPATGLAITQTLHDTQLRYTYINNKHRAAAGPETKGTERDKENQAFLSIGSRETKSSTSSVTKYLLKIPSLKE